LQKVDKHRPVARERRAPQDAHPPQGLHLLGIDLQDLLGIHLQDLPGLHPRTLPAAAAKVVAERAAQMPSAVAEAALPAEVATLALPAKGADENILPAVKAAKAAVANAARPPRTIYQIQSRHC